ncbi:MAG: histone deacetylase family protein [Pseudomonadota bacterium]
MLTFCDPRQLDHAPQRELNNGEWMPYAEVPTRLERIGTALGDIGEVTDHGMDPILAVHDADYVEFLRTAHDRWLADGREGDAIGYAFPVVHRRKLDHTRIDASLGAYAMDAATPITGETWQAAYWSVQTALTGLDALATGERHAFALCRPPGHHAGRDYMGGYCYLNSAAIAAHEASTRVLGPVAVLDVDYHHGNGTQDIFYENADVLFASIHADPKTDFPYYWGHADETGEGDGEGTTLNLPLPRGTRWEAYEAALSTATQRIAEWGARALIVSFGADTFQDDPISHFELTTGDYGRMGAAIAALNLPTLIVMEGGYDLASLGENVARFCDGFG